MPLLAPLFNVRPNILIVFYNIKKVLFYCNFQLETLGHGFYFLLANRGVLWLTKTLM